MTAPTREGVACRATLIGAAEGIALRDGTSDLRYIIGKLYDENVLGLIRDEREACAKVLDALAAHDRRVAANPDPVLVNTRQRLNRLERAEIYESGAASIRSRGAS